MVGHYGNRIGTAVWVLILLRIEQNYQKKYNSENVGLNFQTYIYILNTTSFASV